MADNVTLPATGSVVASDDVSGVQFQKIKLDIGGDGVSTPLSASSPMPAGISGDVVDYYPTYGDAGAQAGTVARATFDPDLNLRTRSAVLTDEGTFRVNFANSAIAVSIGSVTISGNIVTGTGFSSVDVHKGDYFKVDADATGWLPIDSVDSDTQITLTAAYVGTMSGAASRALMKPTVGSGGSLAVASGQCTITSGTTINAVTRLDRDIDIAPLVYRTRFSVSQRIANQTTYAGMTEAEATATERWFARFRIDGTTATTVVTETGRNPTSAPSASEIESNTVVIPNGLTTASMLDWRIEQLTESVRFYINSILVAEHTKVIPSQHDAMDATVAIVNGASAPASSTTVVIDYVTGKNHNKLECGIMSDAEKIVAAQPTIQSYLYNLAGVIAINTDLLVIDCSQLRSLQIQCTSMGTSGVVTPAWSNDGTTFVNTSILTNAGAAAATFNAAGLWTTPCLGKYFRLRLTTATTAGTTTLNVSGLQTVIGPVLNQPISGTVSVTGYPTAAASADALANPTVTQIGAAGLLFNGTSWDRNRNNLTVTMGDTGAKTATFNGATQTNYNARGAYITVAVGTVTGTTPTLACQLQISYDGTNFINLGPASTNITTSTQTCTFIVYPTNMSQTAGATPANITTGASQTIAINAPLPRTWRIVYTIGGTTPSFTLTNAYAAYIL